MQTIEMRFVDTKPSVPTGVTWGVPVPSGELRAGDTAHLRRADGGALPTQIWPLAFWPDGSIKWLGCAAVVGPDDGESFSLVAGPGPAPAQTVRVEQLGVEIFRRVSTGAIVVDVGDRGTAIIQEISLPGGTAGNGPCGVNEGDGRRVIAGMVELMAVQETVQGATRHRASCPGVIQRLTVEQSGPVRAVVKLEGAHRRGDGRTWLPFTVRLAFWGGLGQIDVVHSVVIEGLGEGERIAGLGLGCHVPLIDAVDNRHVRVVGEGGVWCEPARYAHLNAPAARQIDQIAGRRVQARGEDGLLPAWDAFRLEQDSADHFAVRKRQAGPVCWIDCGHGLRAPGVMAVSDPGGGLAVGVEDFWQSFPAALAVEGLTGGETRLSAWFWSDHAEPMDLRHYGIRDHRWVYEAVNPDVEVYSSATGIARTSRATLWVLGRDSRHEEVAALGQLASVKPLFVCEPAHYTSTRVFGRGLAPVDRSTPARAAMEDELEAQFTFFRDQVEAWRWYGFWNHGDVMHTFDQQRRTWRYDIGGCAWNNAELGTDLWLCLDFLRSGRADAFRLAQAMVRHVAEVDSYHLGVWKGQGARHNVVHWGCPCKEPRVSVAHPKRVMYYLTADERLGDLLDEVAWSHLGRATNTPTDPQSWEARIGPTWATYCSNWLTAWERTGDTVWRDRILAGIEGILASPHRLLTGTPFAFDPATGAMRYAGDHPYAHNRLVTVFGGAEAWMELADLLDHDAFAAAVAEYGQVHAATPEMFAKLPATLQKTISLRWSVAKLAAFAAVRDNDLVQARRVWELLLAGDGFDIPGDSLSPRGVVTNFIEPLSGRKIAQSNLSTNHDSQWALNAIAALALAPEALDTWWQEHGRRLWPA